MTSNIEKDHELGLYKVQYLYSSHRGCPLQSRPTDFKLIRRAVGEIVRRS